MNSSGGGRSSQKGEVWALGGEFRTRAVGGAWGSQSPRRRSRCGGG